MITHFTELILALLVIALAGSLPLALIDPTNSIGAGRLTRLSLSFLLGLGMLDLQIFFFSLLGIPATRVTVPALWVVIKGVHLYWRLKDKTHTTAGYPCAQETGLTGWFALLIISSQVCYAFFSALILPIRAWDSTEIWFLKAKVFFVSGIINSGFLFDHTYINSHLDYPLLLPHAIGWIFTALGSVDDILAKALFPGIFMVLLSLFYFFALRLTAASSGKRGLALIGTALLSLSPLIMTQAGGIPVSIGALFSGDYVGYADIGIALFVVAGAGFLCLYFIEGNRAALQLSALLLAFGASTKNEGLVFVFISIVLVALHAFLRRRREIGYKKWLYAPATFFIILAAALMPWLVFKTFTGLGSEYTGALNLSVITGNINRLPRILDTFYHIFFLNIGFVGLVWYFYLISTLLNIRRTFTTPILALHAMLLLGLSAYIFVYIISPHELVNLLGISVIKRTLQIIPLAMLIAVLNLSMLLSKNTKEPLIYSGRSRL